MLIKPIVTEKSFRIASGDKNTKRQFSFYIKPALNKLEAVKLIQTIYKVNVLAATTLTTKSKKVTFKRILGQSQSLKKIIVTLKPGQVIKAFELEEKKEDK